MEDIEEGGDVRLYVVEGQLWPLRKNQRAQRRSTDPPRGCARGLSETGCGLGQMGSNGTGAQGLNGGHILETIHTELNS